MKNNYVGAKVFLLYMALTYMPQFLLHIVSEDVLLNQYRIEKNSQYLFVFIIIFILFVLLIYFSMQFYSEKVVIFFGKTFAFLFESKIFQWSIGLLAITLAFEFYLLYGLDFRHKERMADVGVSVPVLFVLNSYIFAWMLYQYFCAIKIGAINTHAKILSIIFLSSLILSLTGSLNVIFIFWLTILLCASPHKLRSMLLIKKNKRSFLKALYFFILKAIVFFGFVCIAIFIGIVNKIGVEGAFEKVDDLGVVLLTQLSIRLSSSYASAISFASYNLMNSELYLLTIKVPYENFIYRLSLIFNFLGNIERPEYTSIMRLNYLEYSHENYLDHAGASPGLVGTGFFAGPFPVGFLLISIYLVFIMKLIDNLINVLDMRVSIAMIFFLLSMTFALFESPLDYLLIIDPANFYLFFYFASIAAFIYKFRSKIE